MKYTLRIADGGGDIDLECEPEDLRAEVEDFVRGGDYNLSPEDGTIWVDVYITDEDGEEDRMTVKVDPPEPKCFPGEVHDWESPHDIVGGIEENPGVHGHGGGVIIEQVCMSCGTKRTTDTWAQRPDTGEQGLESVSYEEGYYEEDIQALRDEDETNKD